MDIVFENCEVISVEPVHVNYMNIWGVTEHINFSAYSKKTTVSKYAEGFNIGVKSNKALTERCLQYKDITQICWEGQTYFMNWKDYEKDENDYQTVHVEEDTGVLHINISKEDQE